MKLNKNTRVVSILIGLLFIGLLVYKFITVDMENPIIYHESFPEIVDQILPYVILGIKVITILLISTGLRGPLLAGIALLVISVGEAVFVNLDRLVDIYDLFKAQSLDQFFNLLGAENTIYLGLLGVFVIFWLLYAIFVAANIVTKSAPKIILLIISLLPFGIVFQLAVEDKFKIDLTDPIYNLTFKVSMIFIISLMLMFSQVAPKKPEGKHVWFPVIETM